jgi:diguanylate cyclase (GGDEF)-like protein
MDTHTTHSYTDDHAPLISEAEMGPYVESLFPVWIFDFEKMGVHWANQAALTLWEADTLKALQQRQMSEDMSMTVRSRLEQYQSDFSSGRVFDEVWTIFPRSKAKTVLCRFRGCRLTTGRVAMLCEAQLSQVEESQVLRGTQALLYTGAIVTMYDESGCCIYANPAALRAFDAMAKCLSERICNPKVLAQLQDCLTSDVEGKYTSQIQTRKGVRLHEIEARCGFDPATGKKSLLLTEIDISEKEQAKNKVEYLANHDFLTGLYNRQYLSANAAKFIRQGFEDGQGVYICLLDLDRFKFVNDSLGHRVGDQLLKEVSRKLDTCFQNNSIIARFGGDEFCILVRSVKPIIQITRKLRDLVSELKKPIQIGQHTLGIDASVGLSYVFSEKDLIDFDDLLSKADLALYSAKRSGAGTVQIYRQSLYKKRQRFLKIEEELAHALLNSGGGLSLSFQPVVCLTTRKIIGLEALSRLRSREGNNIPPSEFIAIAESTGMINELGGWVLEKAVESHLKMRPTLRGCKLSVNVSPLQFRSVSLINQLKRLKSKSGFDVTKLEIELTETELCSSDINFTKMLQEIVRLGYSLAIDDFGSAYSNISRLDGYPVQTIKIDRSMIAHSDGKLAAGAIEIVKALNLRVVAEGIETQEQSDWLVSKGCTSHQGFLYSKALSFDELMQLPDLNLSTLNLFRQTA